jgi:drug/metabolite transporter (DMT)-like permease
MKVFGMILIVIGIVMIIFRGFNVVEDKKVVDLGPVEINQKQNKWIGWPTYAGGIAVLAGIILVVTDKKKIA